MNLNWLDFVIILSVGFSTAEGIAKGFARVGLGLAAAILGVVLGIWFYGTAGYFFLPYVSHSGIANFIGFSIIFVGCIIAGALLGNGLARLFKWAGLGWVDRILGCIFGTLRGLIACIALVLILIAFSPNPPPRSVERSHWAPYLVGAANVFAEMAPRELRDAFFESYNELKKVWDQAIPKKALRLPETEV